MGYIQGIYRLVIESQVQKVKIVYTSEDGQRDLYKDRWRLENAKSKGCRPTGRVHLWEKISGR